MDDQWDMTRQLGAWFLSAHSKDGISPMDLMELQKDREDELRPITTEGQAKELLKSMLNG